MSEGPKRIWLQSETELLDLDELTPFSDNTSWCEDKINDSDVEYIRADLVTEIKAQNASLIGQIKSMQETESGEKRSLIEENERYREALKTCRQFILEVSHAMGSGPSWYTKGESGLRNQIRTWINKAFEAVKALNDEG